MISMIHEGEEQMGEIGESSPSRSYVYDEVRRSIGEVNSSMKKSVRSSLSQVSQSSLMRKVITVQERGLTYGKKVSQDARGEDKRLRRSLKVDFSYGPSDALKDISANINNNQSVIKTSKIRENAEIKESKQKSSIPQKDSSQNNQQKLQSLIQQQPKYKQKQKNREGNSSAIREKKSRINQEGIMSGILFLILLYLLLIIKSPTFRSFQTTVVQKLYASNLYQGWFA